MKLLSRIQITSRLLIMPNTMHIICKYFLAQQSQVLLLGIFWHFFQIFFKSMIGWIHKCGTHGYGGLVLLSKRQYQFSSVSVMCDSLRPQGLQHTRLPHPLPSPWPCSNSCPLSQWCHPTISSSVVLFSSRLQSFPASGSFQMSQLFTSGGQSIGVSASASVLAMNIQDGSPFGWTGWISLQSKGISRIFSNTAVQKQQLFSAQLSL